MGEPTAARERAGVCVRERVRKTVKDRRRPRDLEIYRDLESERDSARGETVKGIGLGAHTKYAMSAATRENAHRVCFPIIAGARPAYTST